MPSDKPKAFATLGDAMRELAGRTDGNHGARRITSQAGRSESGKAQDGDKRSSASPVAKTAKRAS